MNERFVEGEEGYTYPKRRNVTFAQASFDWLGGAWAYSVNQPSASFPLFRLSPCSHNHYAWPSLPTYYELGSKSSFMKIESRDGYILPRHTNRLFSIGRTDVR
jgi:hypothetical protein